MKYGDYSFSPIPLVSIQKDYQKSGDETVLGSVINITLNGVLTPLPSTAGFLNTTNLQDDLREAFNADGKYFEIACDGNIVFSGCPRIQGLTLEESSNNWVQTIPFSIELQFDVDQSLLEDSEYHPPYIQEASDEWNLEFVQDNRHFSLDLSTVSDQQSGNYYGLDNNQLYVMRVTHNISAKGKRYYNCSTGDPETGSLQKEAWQQARDYVLPRLGFNYSRLRASGSLNLPTGTASVFDHFRTNSINELDGSYSVSESWLVMPSSIGASGLDRCTEDFTVNLRKAFDSDMTTISIDGSIQGLETRDYNDVSGTGDFSIDETAYEAASIYWDFVQPRLLSRVQYIGESDATRSFNPTPANRTVGHNPSKGSISYSYEYNDRPCNFISGALNENFTITDNYPTDVFAKLPVLGRARGPVLQDISTITEQTREITIEVVMPIYDACSSISSLYANKPTGQIQTILCEFETELTNSYQQVFKHADTETWNPREGRYTRNVGWTFQNCTSGNAPDSSFC